MDIPKKIISDKLKGTSEKKDVLFKVKEGSIVWEKLSPEVQKMINSAGGVTTAEITDYMTLGGDLLPMASVFTYEGMPVSHLRTVQTNATVWDLVFCVCHIDGLENLGNLYVHYDWNSPMEGWRFVESFDDSTVPSWILRLFNEAEATTSNSGLMSSGDKTKLNALPTSQELANTLASLVDGGSYDSVDKTIDFRHGNTILFSIDATVFIKDGMVDSVTISGGYLVITFNTDAGKEAISLALTDIFNPANYYDKTAVDNLLANKVDKVSGKGLSTEDYTTAEKTKLGGLPSTLATVATSGSYNDLNNRPCKSADETIYADDLESGTINIDAAGFAIQNIDIYPLYVPITYDGHTYNKYLAVTQSEHRQIIIKSACTISFLVNPITGEYNYSSYYISFNGTEIYHKSWYPSDTKPFVTTLELASAGTLEIYCHDGDFNILKIDCASIDYTFSDVAFSGSYNDLLDKPTLPDAQIQSDWNQLDNTKKDFIKNKPTIPDVTTKADKVSNATNGNFAALDSNGNLIDSGHKHSDYLTQHQDLSNYVQKSQTTGLLKNDGTVDTTQYLSQHQDISGKEDITPIEAVASGTTAITAQVNKYYEVAGTVSSLTVTLPTPTANTEVTMVVVHLTVGASPTVVVTSVNEVVKFSAAYSVVANKEYELSCLYNGSKWIVSSMEVAI